MATLSTVACITGAKNTNQGACTFDPKNFIGAFLCPAGYVIPAAQLATLQARLTLDSQLDNKALRIYPVPNFIGFKDSSEKPVEEKFDYGAVNTVRDGVYDWAFRFRIGALNLSNALRSFNGSAYSFLFVDSKNQILGTQALDNTGAATIGGIAPVEFYQDPFMPNDGKKTTEYWAKFRFFPAQVNENAAYITDATFDIMATIKGLIDFVITGSQTAAGVYSLALTTKVGGVNLASLFGATWNFPALFTAKNNATQAAITITGVVYNATTGLVDLTLTVTSPPYPAVSGKIDFNTVGPTELTTGLIPNYESTGLVTITRTT